MQNMILQKIYLFADLFKQKKAFLIYTAKSLI